MIGSGNIKVRFIFFVERYFMNIIKYLFLILMVATGVYAMEQTHPASLEYMPPEIKLEIIRLVGTADTFDEAINNLRALAATNKAFNTWIKNARTTEELVKQLAHTFKIPEISFKSSTQGIGWNKNAVNRYFAEGNQLVAAVQTNNSRRVEELLKQGADGDFYHLNSFSNQPYTPLTLAIVFTRNKEIMGLLLQYGADPNYGVTPHFIPLELELSGGNVDPETIELLLKYGARVSEEQLEREQKMGDERIINMLKQAIEQQKGK
mgnify:CR=1 FL=1